MKAEIERRLSNLDKVEALFRSHPGEWINARDFEKPGGQLAWRSRIAECRTKRDMHVENRLDRNAEGEVIASWYRFLSYVPLGPDASTERQEKHPPKQISFLESR